MVPKVYNVMELTEGNTVRHFGNFQLFLEPWMWKNMFIKWYLDCKAGDFLEKDVHLSILIGCRNFQKMNREFLMTFNKEKTSIKNCNKQQLISDDARFNWWFDIFE